MTKIIKIILIIAIANFAWDEYNAMSTIVSNNALKEISIENLEKSGAGDANYIQLTDAVEAGRYITIENEETGKIHSVLYLVSTVDKVAAATKDKPLTPKVLVIRKLDKYKNCIKSNDFCIDFKPQSYTGRVSVGARGMIRSLPKEARNTLKNMIKPFSVTINDMILISEDVDPNDELVDIYAPVVLPVIIIFLIIWSFFWKEEDGDELTEDDA